MVQLEHLVCDVNGTLAVDGRLHESLPRIFRELRSLLSIHLVTADTQQLGFSAHRIQPGDEARQKANLVQELGCERVAAIGQGANDAEMLRAAGLGICILSLEGLAVETLMAADIVLPDILSALELFEKPLRIVATLRK